MKIIRVEKNSPYFSALIALEYLLWPDTPIEELAEGTLKCMEKEFFYGAVIDNELIGFIQLSIRGDYVNGTDTSPVGFIEGIYVTNNFRRQKIAQALVTYVCNILKEKSIQEIASDALIDNTLSHTFHKGIGFEETETVVYFRKKI